MAVSSIPIPTCHPSAPGIVLTYEAQASRILAKKEKIPPIAVSSAVAPCNLDDESGRGVVSGMLGFLKWPILTYTPPARRCQIGLHLSSPGFLFNFLPFLSFPLPSSSSLLFLLSSSFPSTHTYTHNHHHCHRIKHLSIALLLLFDTPIQLYFIHVKRQFSLPPHKMKFFATLLFAAAGVSAASSATSPDTPGSTCLADYILEQCLKSTTINVRDSLLCIHLRAS